RQHDARAARGVHALRGHGRLRRRPLRRHAGGGQRAELRLRAEPAAAAPRRGRRHRHGRRRAGGRRAGRRPAAARRRGALVRERQPGAAGDDGHRPRPEPQRHRPPDPRGAGAAAPPAGAARRNRRRRRGGCRAPARRRADRHAVRARAPRRARGRGARRAGARRPAGGRRRGGRGPRRRASRVGGHRPPLHGRGGRDHGPGARARAAAGPGTRPRRRAVGGQRAGPDGGGGGPMTAATSPAAALEVRDVVLRFGGHLARDRGSLTAPAREVPGLIGPNGAGKTTLFNVVTGLQAPQRGTVLLDGQDVTRLAPYRRARRGLARTFQRLELFGLLTVAENVELAASVRGRRRPGRSADEALELVGLRDLAGVRADELPTGKARLVELARALATGPRVLLLDEPASGQSEAETDEFRDVLLTVAGEGIAVVLVEHDVQLVMRTCSQVHVLDFGRVLAAGTPEEIQRNDAVIEAYLGAAPGVPA